MLELLKKNCKDHSLYTIFSLATQNHVIFSKKWKNIQAGFMEERERV